MKLTAPQLRVLRLMRDGWELGIDVGYDGKARLQYGGIGRGGESVPARRDTIRSLSQRKLVEYSIRQYPTQRYQLTALGREAAGEGT